MKKINNKGQALVEYILIIGLISVIAVAAVSLLGQVVMNKITETSCNMMGQEYKVDKETGKGYCVDPNEKLGE